MLMFFNYVEFFVEFCELGVKGDIVMNVIKLVKLEIGVEIVVFVFIEMGNIFKVDMRIGEYVECVKSWFCLDCWLRFFIVILCFFV